MSRSDLDKIQSRLKTSIQTHQMLVSKMKSDPQNTSVQQQLHDIQTQITTLSERQKCIVQSLRKELVQKPNGSTKVTANQVKTITVKQESFPQNEMNSKFALIQSAPIKVLPTLAPKPEGFNSDHAIQKDSFIPTNNVGQAQEKAKTASEVLMQSKNAMDNNNKAIQSSNITNDKNSSSIKVPQFHTNRPSILQGGSRCIYTKSVHSSYIPVSARRGSETEINNLRKASLSREAATPEERKKLEFMASLDLITPDTLKELQSKRSERKRRSTANPQFSYGNFEPERKRSTASYLSQVPIQQGARKRAPESSTPGSDVHEDFCAVCGRIGELLMCDTCNLVYHLGCLEPPLTTIPQGLWSCPKCNTLNKQTGTNWSGTLAFVRSYITHKAAKEEEKQKLKSQTEDLKNQKKELEAKVNKLNESIAQMVCQKADLAVSNRTAQQSVDQLKSLIRLFQTS